MIAYLYNYFTARLKSFSYAFKGLSILFKTQANARIHLVALGAVVVAGLFFSLSISEWCLCSLCIGMVLAVEAVNTAIESIVDLVSPDYHPLAGRAKDVAAAAVLLTAISAAVVGILIFLPKIIQYFSN
jgi:diacylglycerol kinase (ATP)